MDHVRKTCHLTSAHLKEIHQDYVNQGMLLLSIQLQQSFSCFSNKTTDVPTTNLNLQALGWFPHIAQFVQILRTHE